MTAGPITTPIEKDASPQGRRSNRGWWIATAVVLLPALIPPISLAWQVVTQGIETPIPLGRLIELFLGTLALTVAVTITALGIGTATA